MSKRTLKRQLSLFQTIMLGTAGALGSGIFVLTGLAAEVAGPATVLAVLVAGLLSFSIALNYSELATVYPETGGAMTYVREAWGKGLLSFLIGSMDSISSTFYTALSAVGFAYSLSVFIPSLPIIPAAIAVILVFTVLNILGVTRVGNLQMVMGAALLFAFGVFIFAGLLSPAGFRFTTLFPQGQVFTGAGFFPNLGIMLITIALIYAAYVGFEVIADDAEEVKNPNKNIPTAILISLSLITLIYMLTVLVTLGTLPWQSVAGSPTALSDAVRVFLPGIGVTIIAMAGIVGAITSINSSMLSATRETFTLGRDSAWPAALSRLNRVRVPFLAILMVGGVSILITLFGVVDFLSYITSAGYLFVLFFSNLAMIRLRQKHPAIHRPFKAPLFPLTPILASLTCLIVICFSDLDALLFTGLIIAGVTVYYYASTGMKLYQDARQRNLSPGRWRILIPLTEPERMDGVMQIGSLLAEYEKDLILCLLNILPTPSTQPEPADPAADMAALHAQNHAVLDRFSSYAVERNVPMYTKLIAGASAAEGVVTEISNHDNVKLVLMKWPHRARGGGSYLKTLVQVAAEAPANLAVLHDRGVQRIRNILVPVGGGANCRLAIQLANNLAEQERARVLYLRVITSQTGQENAVESQDDYLANLQEVVMTQLGQVPANASLRIQRANSVQEAVLKECEATENELVIIGSEFDINSECLFGQVCEDVVEKAPCSVLVVRHHASATATWLHHQVRKLQRD